MELHEANLDVRNQFVAFHQDHMTLSFHRGAMRCVKCTLKERVGAKKTKERGTKRTFLSLTDSEFCIF